LLWTSSGGVHPVSDAEWYVERGMGIAGGEGYVIDGTPTAYWPVGYPAFLGGIFSISGGSLMAATIANLILALGALYLSYRIARRLFDSERIGLITLALLAIHPNHIAYTSLMMSEILFLFLLMLGVALQLESAGRIGRMAMAGVVYGAAVLVKPQAIFVPAICWLAIAIGTHGRTALREWRSWGRLGMIYMLAALVVIPWTLRNHALFGHHGIISTNDGINLLIGNHPRASGAYPEEEVLNRLIGRIILKHITKDRESWSSPDSVLNEHEMNVEARKLAIEYIAGNPLDAIAILPRKLWYLYRADVEGFTLNARGLPIDRRENAGKMLDAMKIGSQIWWVLFLGAAGAYIIARLRRGAKAFLLSPSALGLWIVIYFTAIPLIYFGDGRFHFPAIPWLAMFAAGFVAMMMERRRDAEDRADQS
jgi:hypothetical protein